MAEQDDARIAEIRARLATARTVLRGIDEVLEYGSHEDCACDDDEGCPDCIVPMVRARLTSDVARLPDDTAYLLARLDALTAERNSLVEDNTALRWKNGDSYDTWPLARLREPEYFKVGDRELEKTAVCRCCDASWAWSYVSPDGYCLHCVDGRADLLAERDALAARLAAAEAVEKVLRDGLRDLRGYSVSNWFLVDSTLAFAEKAALAGSREQPQGEGAR